MCRGQEHQQPLWYPMVEGVKKSKERPFKATIPGVCLGGSYKSLMRRGVSNSGVSGPRPTAICSTPSLQHRRGVTTILIRTAVTLTVRCLLG